MKNFIMCLVTPVMICFFCMTTSVVAQDNYAIQNNTLDPGTNLIRSEVGDHAVPDKCSSSRKGAYKSCLTSIVTCAGICAPCAIPVVGLPACVACAAVCPTAASTCGGYVGTYDTCCRNLKDDPAHGWTKSELQNAALCGSCMSKNDVIKDICNK